MKLPFPSFAAAFLVSQSHAAKPVSPFHLDAAVESDDAPELSLQKGSEFTQLRVGAAAAVNAAKGKGKHKTKRRGRKGNKGGGRRGKTRSSSNDGETPSEAEEFSAVYAMTNQPNGNSILVYSRSTVDGTLEYEGSFPTGGNGAGQAGTAPGDPLAAQDPIKVVGDCLLAVNAGSGSISSFHIDSADSITRVSMLPTGGDLPVSLTEKDNFVYVLNSGASGSFKGFTLGDDCDLSGLTSIVVLDQGDVSPVGPPAGIATPAEIGFTPEGNLIVLIKVEGGGDNFSPPPNTSGFSSINHYEVQPNGKIKQSSLVKTLIEDRPGSLPFAFDFDSEGRLLVAEALINHVSEWEINDDFTYTQVNEVDTQQGASCWIRFNPANECVYTSNSAGNSISSLGAVQGSDHQLVESVAAGDIPGPIDLITSGDGQNLYVLSPDVGGDNGPGIYVYSTWNDCSLTQLPTVRDGLDSSFLEVTGVAGIAAYPAVPV